MCRRADGIVSLVAASSRRTCRLVDHGSSLLAWFHQTNTKPTNRLRRNSEWKPDRACLKSADPTTTRFDAPDSGPIFLEMPRRVGHTECDAHYSRLLARHDLSAPSGPAGVRVFLSFDVDHDAD